MRSWTVSSPGGHLQAPNGANAQPGAGIVPRRPGAAGRRWRKRYANQPGYTESIYGMSMARRADDNSRALRQQPR